MNTVASTSQAVRCQPQVYQARCCSPAQQGRLFFTRLQPKRSGRTPFRTLAAAATDARQTLLDSIAGAKGRGKEGLSKAQLAAVDSAVQELERSKGIQAPTASGKLEGRWKLLYTTRPGTSSPIQRSFIGVDSFSVFQDISLSRRGQGRVTNVVQFGKDGAIGQLRVEAEANTDSNPLPGFTPRRGAGLPLFGKSSAEPPASKDMRIDFQFDRAAFDFKRLPFKVPYPVPFKLLGDETKGWIDITYLSSDGQFRLTRGNKGTLFVLTKSSDMLQ